jgi:glucan phosphoethanolaminetransferase (alkaline phosphatase superfamily)
LEQNNQNQKISISQKARKIIYYIFGILEVLFAFRLVFKILGANPQSGFVAFIYSITKLFLTPFAGIFRMAVSNGIETQSVLEPTLIIAMIVYAALCWGIVQLVKISSNREDPKTL